MIASRASYPCWCSVRAPLLTHLGGALGESFRGAIPSGYTLALLQGSGLSSRTWLLSSGEPVANKAGRYCGQPTENGGCQSGADEARNNHCLCNPLYLARTDWLKVCGSRGELFYLRVRQRAELLGKLLVYVTQIYRAEHRDTQRRANLSRHGQHP